MIHSLPFVLSGIGNFSLHHRVRTGSEAHPASVPGSLSLGVKRAGREADYSPISSARCQRTSGTVTPFPNTPSWRGAQLKAQGQLYLCFTFKRCVF
jgi:hypothetical protein